MCWGVFLLVSVRNEPIRSIDEIGQDIWRERCSRCTNSTLRWRKSFKCLLPYSNAFTQHSFTGKRSKCSCVCSYVLLAYCISLFTILSPNSLQYRDLTEGVYYYVYRWGIGERDKQTQCWSPRPAASWFRNQLNNAFHDRFWFSIDILDRFSDHN